jgi:hypothetical protein
MVVVQTKGSRTKGSRTKGSRTKGTGLYIDKKSRIKVN